MKHLPGEVTDSLSHPAPRDATPKLLQILSSGTCKSDNSYTQQSSLSFQILASSNTWRWRNIFCVCWPKGLQQWHNQSAKGGYFMICALFSLLSTDYGNQIMGFRVPIQPHNSSLFHSDWIHSDPEMSLFRDSCEKWKGYSSGGSAPLACCCVPHPCPAAGEVPPKWMLVTCYKIISASEDKHWCSSWRIPGQASQRFCKEDGEKRKSHCRGHGYVKAKQESLPFLETKEQSIVGWRKKRKGQEYKCWDKKHCSWWALNPFWKAIHAAWKLFCICKKPPISG